MAESPLQNQSFAHRLGYKLRWLYLGLVVFGAIVWWARYFGQTGWLFWSDNWDLNDPWEYANPLLRVFDLSYFYWTGTVKNRVSGSGVQWVWGFSTPWVWNQIMNGGAGWKFVGVGFGLGGPLVMALSVMGFVGIARRSKRQLPAVKTPGFLSRGMGIFIMGLVLSASLLVSLHLFDSMTLWSQYAQSITPNSGGRGWYRESVFVGLLEWPIHPVWLIVPAMFFAWWLLNKQVHRGDQYWQMEKTCRWVLFTSAVLFAFSIGFWFTDTAYIMIDYWAIDVLKTTTFCSSTALVWASSCRVWLLFRLVEYEKQRVAMMTESPVCFACEYDLTGSLRGGMTRCPECGVAVPGEVVRRFGGGVEEAVRPG